MRLTLPVCYIEKGQLPSFLFVAKVSQRCYPFWKSYVINRQGWICLSNVTEKIVLLPLGFPWIYFFKSKTDESHWLSNMLPEEGLVLSACFSLSIQKVDGLWFKSRIRNGVRKRGKRITRSYFIYTRSNLHWCIDANTNAH